MKTYLTVIAIALLATATSAGLVAGEKVQANTHSVMPARNGLQESTRPPAEQGISTPDLLTTRDINQEIASASQLSASGRDARVATYRGRVVLRGVVQSAEEKKKLEEIAARRAGSMNVQDELDIRGSSE